MIKKSGYEYLLVSYNICPYVQRVAFFLADVGVDFKIKYINPYKDKPDWFMEISPTGKVPLLVITQLGEKKAVLYESTIILECLNDIFDGRYLPADPIEKAVYRLWIQKVEKLQSQLNELFGSSSESSFAEDLAGIRLTAAEIEESLTKIIGKEKISPSLFVYSIAPVLFLVEIVELFTAIELLPQLKVMKELSRNILTKESFRKTINQEYYSSLIDFFVSKGSFLSLQTNKFLGASNWEVKLANITV